ncbi:MAG: hypothetical protein RRZ24_08940 [Clostridia bacterium]
METSLYIANERITAVVGHAVDGHACIKQYASVPLAAGSVLGGVITDEKGLSEALLQLREAFQGGWKRVRLVIGGNQINVKRAVVPKISQKQLKDWVANEFSDVELDDDALICEYMLLSDLGKDKGNTALLCAAKESLIASYVELFDTLGIKIACINTTLPVLQKLVRFLEKNRQGACIVLSMDGNALDATLFVRGEFRFNNRARLIAARGTAESTAEISRMVSSIIQFNLSERSGESITNVYVIGCRPEENDMLQNISTAYDLPAAVLKDSGHVVTAPDSAFALSDYAYAVANLGGM